MVPLDADYARHAAPLDEIAVDWVNDPPDRLRAAYDAARARIAGDRRPDVAQEPFEAGGVSGLIFRPRAGLAPAAPETGAAIAYFHGGGWVVGSPETHA